MATAMITRTIEYTVDLDSPLWPSEMPYPSRLNAWLEMARIEPVAAFENLEKNLDVIYGKITKGDDYV